jgi:hypothetical protein
MKSCFEGFCSVTRINSAMANLAEILQIKTMWEPASTYKCRVNKAINLEGLILKGRNRKAPPKGNHKPFGGLT